MSTVQNAEPICPYCGFVFDVMPSRKLKCPQCLETIYRQSYPPDNLKMLLTVHQAAAAKRAWYERDRKKEEDEINKHIATLQTSTDHHERKLAYLGLSIYYWKKGAEFRNILIECQKGQCIEELSEYLASSSKGVKHVRIVSSPNTCQDLNVDHNEIYTIANALALMPIPHIGSDDGLCQCFYEIVFDDELPLG